jgi:glutathione peroxidase-family protein
MHTMTIAEAVTSGRPSVIIFATPAFCLSRICGPTKDVVDDLFEQYKDEVNFVHVEPYFLELAREGKALCSIPVFNLQGARERWGGAECPVLTDDELPPPDQSWNLTSEPWVFLVDSEGNIAAKFEAVVTMDELKAALEPLLPD